MIDECAWCRDLTWCRDTPKGPQCKGCQYVLFFRNVLFQPSKMTWLPWHEQLIRGVFGRVDAETGLRVVRTAFVSTAKKNGKSALLGGMPIAHLMLEDREVMPRAIGAATTRKQAKEVFDSAAMMVRNSPFLRERLDIVPSRGWIRRWDNDWMYEVISSEGRHNDGMRPSFWVVDEIHRFHNQGEQETLDALSRGTRGRRQPLGIVITTAGDPDVSLAWKREYDYSRQVASGAVVAPHHFPLIFEADQSRLEADPDYWASKEARLAANPSHEDFGGFVTDAELLMDLEKAKHIPATRRGFMRFTLNVPSESDDKLIAGADWQACGRIDQRPLIGRRCILGIDLSQTTDLTAMVAVFPDEKDQSYDVLSWFWMASEQLSIRMRLDRQPYDQWVRDGYIEITEGKVINYDALVKRVKWCQENFEVEEICIDPAGARKLMHDTLQHMGTCVTVRQGFALSEEIGHMSDAILEHRLRHGNNPVLSWNASCVRAKTGGDGRMMLVKPDHKRDASRIDGVSALVTAMHRAMLRVMPEPEPVF